MPGIKIVCGLKDGRSCQKELAEDVSKTLWGKKIGDTLSGDTIGFPGYEFTVKGGSDYCGFPMRKDVGGPVRRRIFAVQGVGLKKIAKGVRVRKTVCGNTIHPKIVQVNLQVMKEGPVPLVAPKAETTVGAQGTDAKSAEKKEETK